MEFWKMNGAGNDFIVVDDRQDAIPDEKWPEIIRTVCERHMSIGADGLGGDTVPTPVRPAVFLYACTSPQPAGGHGAV